MEVQNHSNQAKNSYKAVPEHSTQQFLVNIVIKVCFLLFLFLSSKTAEQAYLYYIFFGVKIRHENLLAIRHTGHGNSKATVGQLVRIRRKMLV